MVLLAHLISSYWKTTTTKDEEEYDYYDEQSKDENFQTTAMGSPM
jgi:hypothetical protein